MEKKYQEMLVGITLGDGHVGRSGDYTYFTLEQSVQHKDYVFDVHNKLSFSGLPIDPIKYYSRIDTRHSKINESAYFKIQNTDLLNFLSDMFIIDGRKVVPHSLKDWLTPISLAHWICCDGQLVKNGGITLCTDNYTLEKVKIIIDALESNFHAISSIHNKKGKSGNIYHRIYIKKASFDSIKPLIREHVHLSFLYKLHE